MNVISKQNK